MKRLLTATLFALISHQAFAGSHDGRGWHSSLSTFEQGDPDVYQRIAPDAANKGSEAARTDSLDQFEMGDPDEMAVSGYPKSTRHPGSSGPAISSLVQFERGDPDENPGG